jgi:guanylate kinase
MGKHIVIVGGIASGKTTLAKALMCNGFKKQVTYTTRPKRDGERYDIDYHFIDEYEFKLRIRDGFFAESIAYNIGNRYWYYGSSKESYHSPDDTVIILDPRGVINLTEPAFTVFLDLPEDILRYRAKERGNTEEEIDGKIKDDKLYFEEMINKRTPDMRIRHVLPVDTMVEWIMGNLGDFAFAEDKSDSLHRFYE